MATAPLAKETPDISGDSPAAVVAANEQAMIAKFRNVLNQFKRPYIELTDKPATHASQTMNALEDVFEHIHTLYSFLQPILETGGQVPSELKAGSEQATIVAVFEQEGILEALRANPVLKEGLLRYLTLDLITYPYTLNPDHISTLDVNAITSHQAELVDNNRDD
jgi:hypothetical protein